MNIETNIEGLLPELIEEVKFFKNIDELEIVHNERVDGNTFYNSIIINGREYTYINSASSSLFGYGNANQIVSLRYKKRFAKLSLYKAMSDFLNEKLPWGALTGIRPVKFAYAEGDGWKTELRDTFCVEESKLDIVERIMCEQEGLYEIKDGNCDLFVGIPFCPSRCLYCSFISSEIGKSKLVEQYVDALVKEINAVKQLIGTLRSVYIGGGTPISLPKEQLEKILIAIGNPNVEYTVEAGRPDCMNEDILSMLKSYGVTRICVNPQTFNDKTLELLGRKHSVADIYEKFELARKIGFDINMDLIAGLPEESFDDFAFSIDSAINIHPENITVHTLSLKKGSKLKEMVDRLPDGQIGKMVDYSAQKLIASGYNPYYMYRQKYMAGNLENTGYTISGKACIYNIDVMEEIADNVACGANAVSKKLFWGGERIERYGAPKDIATYIDKIDTIIEQKNNLFNAK